MHSSSDFLSPERPKVDPNEDRLGYADFANNLAKGICRMSPPEGLVIAVYGAWGSGKSTLLNFIEYYINQSVEDERPQVIRFNPWWFSGYENLTRTFFSTVSAEIATTGDKTQELIKKQLANLANLYSTGAPIFGLPGAGLAKSIGGALRKPAEITVTKRELSSALEGAKHRILVIIDDIDRLTADEIRQLFGVIKAVADFPNVIYLLSFDKNVVVKALAQSQGMPGAEYLEKIVQVPLELPEPDKFGLGAMFQAEVSQVLAGTEADVWKKADWDGAYRQVCDRLIETPRDVFRIINALKLTYPLVVNEVNPSDFVAIETIRLAYPDLYAAIRDSPSIFAGAGTFTAPSRQSPDPLSAYREFIDATLQQLDELQREPVKNALMYLFPKLRSYYGPVRETYMADVERRQLLRISSVERFPVYFRLALPLGGISSTEMRAIISLASTAGRFEDRLMELRGERRPDGLPRLAEFLSLLADHAKEVVPVQLVEPVLSTLVGKGDAFIGEDDPSTGDDGRNELRIARIVTERLDPLSENERFHMLENALRAPESTTAPLLLVHELGKQHGRFNSTNVLFDAARTVNPDHLAQLEKLIAEIIQLRASTFELVNVPYLITVIQYAQDYVPADTLKQWFSLELTTNEEACKLLRHFVRAVPSDMPPAYSKEPRYDFDLSILGKYADLNVLNARIRSLNSEVDLSKEPVLKRAVADYVARLDSQEEQV